MNCTCLTLVATVDKASTLCSVLPNSYKGDVAAGLTDDSFFHCDPMISSARLHDLQRFAWHPQYNRITRCLRIGGRISYDKLPHEAFRGLC